MGNMWHVFIVTNLNRLILFYICVTCNMYFCISKLSLNPWEANFISNLLNIKYKWYRTSSAKRKSPAIKQIETMKQWSAFEKDDLCACVLSVRRTLVHHSKEIRVKSSRLSSYALFIRFAYDSNASTYQD